MRYDDFRRSDNIDDRRDDSGGFGGGGGGGFGFPMGGGGGLGIGTVIVLGLIGWAVGIDPRILIGGAEILTGGQQQAPTYQTDRRSSSPPKAGAPTDEMGSMIAGVLGEIDDRWSEIFSASGQTYRGPRIVLFKNATNGAVSRRCGAGSLMQCSWLPHRGKEREIRGFRNRRILILYFLQIRRPYPLAHTGLISRAHPFNCVRTQTLREPGGRPPRRAHGSET